MRKKFIAGNWKMNLDLAGVKALTAGLKERLRAMKPGSADIAVCPSFVYVPVVVELLAGSAIQVGAQNMYFESNGAFTGEISAAMLKDIGCRYVILGHSERRHILGETDAVINKKLKAALAGSLDPIFCIGELLQERESSQTEAVLERQIRQGLSGITTEQVARITVAYEPVWAIGTGKTATPQQAQEAHAFTRKMIAELYGRSLAETIRIQYGGSVKPDNAGELLRQPDVDGALVGGASLKVNDFVGIIENGIGHCGCGSCGCKG
jgi:triosephosphate isomerase (TIM)